MYESTFIYLVLSNFHTSRPLKSDYEPFPKSQKKYLTTPPFVRKMSALPPPAVYADTLNFGKILSFLQQNVRTSASEELPCPQGTNKPSSPGLPLIR